MELIHSRHNQLEKAIIFHRFETLSLFIEKWKSWSKVQREIRMARQIKEEKDNQMMKWSKAKWFHEDKILRYNLFLKLS